eukprot:CAMPEP_0170301876 /NCGR_PEP_ID=MMETSP0116_2-20130129/51206_1 /TAXON_ID=400756 /ORGANISM="Durinskia baltica, Strain CSIRO CS-38" /LENGTH=50 /DNA_ID=CAMNT_0010553715 /DNA_START=63 /DNA_END=212 /DNA_ORIENTATION=-
MTPRGSLGIATAARHVAQAQTFPRVESNPPPGEGARTAPARRRECWNWNN